MSVEAHFQLLQHYAVDKIKILVAWCLLSWFKAENWLQLWKKEVGGSGAWARKKDETEKQMPLQEMRRCWAWSPVSLNVTEINTLYV